MKQDKPSAKGHKRSEQPIKPDVMSEVASTTPKDPDVKPEPPSKAAAALAGGLAGSAVGGLAGLAAAGPVGLVAGAVAGATAGTALGDKLSQRKAEEDDYWRENYTNRPYVKTGASYDDYSPAYRYGVDAHAMHRERGWDEAREDIEAGWARARGKSKLEWPDAEPAVRDAWERMVVPPA